MSVSKRVLAPFFTCFFSASLVYIVPNFFGGKDQGPTVLLASDRCFEAANHTHVEALSSLGPQHPHQRLGCVYSHYPSPQKYLPYNGRKNAFPI